jgi:hypothetical protein
MQFINCSKINEDTHADIVYVVGSDKGLVRAVMT